MSLPEDVPGGSGADGEAGSPGFASQEDTYTVPEAAKILRVTDRAVRKWLAAGDLEGEQDPDSGRWTIPQRAVHARMEDRPAKPRSTTEGSSEAAGASDRADEMLIAVRDLERLLGRAEARAELTERAESTLREERDRLVSELESEREERRRLQERLDEATRSWWRRLFGR